MYKCIIGCEASGSPTQQNGVVFCFGRMVLPAAFPGRGSNGANVTTGTFLKKRQTDQQCTDESGRESEMSVHNITPLSNAMTPKRPGAVIRSVATVQEYKVHYGVQSATFVRTVFPGQASGTYRINNSIPTWQGPQYTASAPVTSSSPTGGSSSRSAGSPPVPYPPHNASAYYSPPHTRIVPNPCYSCYNKYR